MKRSHLVREIIEIVVFTFIIFFVLRFVIQSYSVEGVSMQPGLQKGQSVLVNKISYLFQSPERGDLTVVRDPFGQRKVDSVLRIIGLPGDTVRTDLQRLWVNDVELKEPYITKAANLTGQQWKVPQNQYFVLCDNREVSDDSRVWGPVPKDFIIGKAVLVYWPLTAFKWIDTNPAVFQGLKKK